MTLPDVEALERRHVLQVYRRAGVVFERGEGARLFDDGGREYIDLISGIGVTSLGHANPGLVEALAAQAQDLLHCSNLFYHPWQGQVADRLAALSGLSRVFFCNSGTEAVEACLKFARRHWYTRGDAKRTEIVSLDRAFHGRTYGALSVTAGHHYRDPFAPLLPHVRFVSADSPDSLRKAVSPATAAIVIEPIQGEGGVRPLSRAFARAVTEACWRTGALLIVDEVQCGLGRTGYPFYFSALGLEPHLVAVGKALGGGVPIGAALVADVLAESIALGDHGSTFGGNPLACRAALVVLEALTAGGLIARAGRLGAHVADRLAALARKHPAILAVRGAGLMWGIELTTDATATVEAALAHGVLINRTAETVLRLLPPLNISQQELDRGLDILDVVLAEAFSGVPA